MPVKTKLDPQKRFNVILRKKQKISKHCQKEGIVAEEKFFDCMRKENDPAAIFLPQKPPRSRVRTEVEHPPPFPMKDIENELLMDNPLPSNLLTPNTPLSKQMHFRRHHQGQFTPHPQTKRISQPKGLTRWESAL